MLNIFSSTPTMIKFVIILCLVTIGCTLVSYDKDISTEPVSYDINGTSSGDIKVKGKVNSSMTYIWHIIVNTTNKTAEAATVHLKELYLDEDDDVTFYLPNSAEILFGPYHGSIGSTVVLVEKDDFLINLTTSSTNMNRKFDAYFNYDCNIPVSDISMISSPHYKPRDKVLECQYRFSDPLFKSRSLVFSGFHLSSNSTMLVSHSDGQDGSYNSSPPDIFSKKQITLKFSLYGNSTENTFTIYNRETLQGCSGYIVAKEGQVTTLKSYPQFILDNDTVPHECRWLIKTDDKSPVLGMVFDKLQFSSVLDTLVMNDGPSEMSPPLFIASRANQNDSKGAVIRTSGPYLWVSFRSLEFSSNFSGNVSVHGQGGYCWGQGSISMLPTVGNDTVFMLEVNANDIVLLNFTNSGFEAPAKLTVYEDFDTESHWLAQFHGNIWAPVVSRTSKMMLVAESFSIGKFDAEFRGIKSGCMHTSPPTGDSYILSGNCKSTCMWMVPPQSNPGGVVQLQFQFLALDHNDELQVVRLDEKKTLVTTIGSNITRVPQLSMRADEGFYVSVKRGNCSKEDDIILIAHSTYHSACSKDIIIKSGADVQIASPGYPDTYPLLSNCHWNITSSSASDLIHLTFDKLQLAPNHCLNITQAIYGQKGFVQQTFTGHQLPDDLLNAAAILQFDAFNCYNTSDKLSLISSEGFSLRATSLDCGAIMNQATGTFGTEGFPKPVNKSNLCIWKVQVPAKDKDSANFIIFSIDIKGDTENHILKIFDGASVRDTVMMNLTGGEIWSRNYTVLFEYRRLNSLLPSAAINITYRIMSCNSTMKCKNGICMHRDWLCNQKNDCGDNTDELNCGSVPVPEPKKQAMEGIAPVTYGVSIVCFFFLGVVATLGVPYLIQRYRNGRYHQFRDLSDGN